MILGKYTIRIFRNAEINSENITTRYIWGLQIICKKADYLLIKHLGIVYFRSGIHMKLGFIKRKQVLTKAE